MALAIEFIARFIERLEEVRVGDAIVVLGRVIGLIVIVLIGGTRGPRDNWIELFEVFDVLELVGLLRHGFGNDRRAFHCHEGELETRSKSSSSFENCEGVSRIMRRYFVNRGANSRLGNCPRWDLDGWMDWNRLEVYYKGLVQSSKLR